MGNPICDAQKACECKLSDRPQSKRVPRTGAACQLLLAGMELMPIEEGTNHEHITLVVVQ